MSDTTLTGSSGNVATAQETRGSRPKPLFSGRSIVVYGTLILVSLYYLLPLYVMVITSVKDMAQKDLELQKRQKDRADADVKAEKARQGDARRRDLCLVVRGRLKDMREGKPVFRYDAGGARVILDEKARAAEMDKELDAEKKYCGEPSA